MFKVLMGLRIAERRKSLRWSQEALAHEAGWSRQQLSRVELGKSSIATDRLLTVADVLECEVADLIPSKAEVERFISKNKSMTDAVQDDAGEN